jgi:hypothetical protein
MLGSKKRRGQSPSHARSKRQEAETAERLGGRTQKGSGCGHYQKGDVRVPKLARVEAKTTKHDSLPLTVEMIQKLEDACVGADEVPVIEVELRLGKHRCYVIPDYAIEFVLGLK